MQRIAYITNIAADVFSGGFSAMNRAMYDFLALNHGVDYIGPINPRRSLWQHGLSKARRLVGLEGDFFFFSERRLERIRQQVEERLNQSQAGLAVFHGFTPWIHTRSAVPFVAWGDCNFWQYIHIYHDASRFRTKDIERIRKREASWLRDAVRVFFRSDWAASEAVRDYHLDEARVRVVRNYGFADPPSRDCYANGRNFLMVTTNFQQKGGEIALRAFRHVHNNHPDTKLVIIGDHPGSRALRQPGVVYLGWIDKSCPERKALLNKVTAEARCLLHPTTADTNPMVLIEAGYFGCPAISVKRYAIPELVLDGVSGLLLNDPTDTAALAAAMDWMLRQEQGYLGMRKEVRAHMLAHYTREAFHHRLSSEFAAVEQGI